MTLFANRIFAGVIKMKSYCISVGLKYNEGVLVRRGEDTNRHRKEGHVMTKAEFGMMQLCLKKCQGMWEPSEGSKRQERILPSGLQKHHGPADSLILDIYSLEMWGNKYLSF